MEQTSHRGLPVLLAVLLLAGFPAPARGEEAWRVSVVPFRHSLDVPTGDADALARLFETALIRAGAWPVVKQSDMDAVLSAQEASLSEYADRDLAVAVGKVLSASHIFVGSVERLGRTYVVSIQLVDVEKGRAVKAETAEAVRPEGFLDAMGAVAARFAGREAAPAAADAADYRIRTYTRIGDRFAALRRFDAAILQYRKALALDEFDVDVLWRIAAAMKEKMLSESLYAANAVTTGQDVAVRDDVLVRGASSADVEAALEVLYTVEAIDPILGDDVSMLLDEAQLLKLDGQAAAAVSVLQRARRIYPDHPAILAELGLLSALKPPRADGLAMIRRAVEREPGNPLFRLYLGRTLQRDQGAAGAEALRSYRKAAELSRSSDFREGRIRRFALRSIQTMLYELGDREGGILTRDLAMPAEERLDLLRYVLAAGAVFDTKTPTRNPDLYQAALCHATGRTAEAEGILAGMLGPDPAKWQAYQLPWVELYGKVLAAGGRSPALLASVRAREAELRRSR